MKTLLVIVFIIGIVGWLVDKMKGSKKGETSENLKPKENDAIIRIAKQYCADNGMPSLFATKPCVADEIFAHMRMKNVVQCGELQGRFIILEDRIAKIEYREIKALRPKVPCISFGNGKFNDTNTQFNATLRCYVGDTDRKTAAMAGNLSVGDTVMLMGIIDLDYDQRPTVVRDIILVRHNGELLID